MEIAAGTLQLRPWRLTDADVVARALRDPEIRRWATGAPADPGEADSGEREWLAQRIDGWTDESSVSFAIADATTGEVLGHIRVRLAGGGLGEVGYWILPAARGRGVATRALGVVGRWAFACLEVSRLELRHAAANAASCRVAQKSGFALVRLLSEPSWHGKQKNVEVHLHALSPE